MVRLSNSAFSPAITAVNVGIGRTLREVFRELDLRQSEPLGLQPRLSRDGAVILLGDDLQIGAGGGLVQPDDDVARRHAVALLDQDFSDDAAGLVLHLLGVALDNDIARGNHRPGERGRRRPRPDAADKQDGYRQAEQDVGSDAFAGARALF